MSERYVLDASAILALLGREPGELRVRAALREGECFVSAVNLAEVASRLSLRGLPASEVRALSQIPGLSVRSFDEEQGLRVGGLALLAKPFGLSLGDRACLALGASIDAIVLTADRVWVGLAAGCVVEAIR